MRTGFSNLSLVVGLMLLAACGGGEHAPVAPSGGAQPPVSAPPPPAAAEDASSRSAAKAVPGDAGVEVADAAAAVAADASGELGTEAGAPATPTGRVRFGMMSDGAHIPLERLWAVARGRKERCLSCYQQGLKRNPKLEGHVLVKLVLDRSGLVSASDAASGLPDQGVIDCIVKAFRKLDWPKSGPRGGAVIIPVILRNGQDQ